MLIFTGDSCSKGRSLGWCGENLKLSPSGLLKKYVLIVAA